MCKRLTTPLLDTPPHPQEKNKQKEGIKGFLSRLVNKKDKLKALPNGTQEIQHNEMMSKAEIVWEPEKRVDINERINSDANPFISRLRDWKKGVSRKHGNEGSQYVRSKAKDNKKRNSEDIDDIQI